MKYLIIILLLAACQVKDPQPLMLKAKSVQFTDTVPTRQDSLTSWENRVRFCDTCRFQTEHVFGTSERTWVFQYNSDTLNCMLTVTQEGGLTIQGDTLTIVRKLFEYIRKSQDTETEVRKALNAAVDFTNTVGSEYKQGERWEAYQRELKKQGYTVIKLPKKISEKQ